MFFKVIALTVALVATSIVLAPSSALAAAPPWGACGVNTAENKLVRQFYVNPRTYFNLRCGGPIRSSDPRYGYRHILRYHKTDFERMAVGTGQNWRDVADLAMDSISRDPDSAKPAGGGQGCYSRVLFFYNIRTNQLVRQQIFKMFVNISTNNINTLFPATSQC